LIQRWDAIPATRLAAMHADGYADFDRLFESGRIQEIACRADARRKFFDPYEAAQSPIAKEALDRKGPFGGRGLRVDCRTN
jgi:hypothetical protein